LPGGRQAAWAATTTWSSTDSLGTPLSIASPGTARIPSTPGAITPRLLEDRAGDWTDIGAPGNYVVHSLAWDGTDNTLYAARGEATSTRRPGQATGGHWRPGGPSGNVNSLAWNGTTLYAGDNDGHVYSKTVAGSWTDIGAAGQLWCPQPCLGRHGHLYAGAVIATSTRRPEQAPGGHR